MQVATVKVKTDNEQGYQVINASDFDQGKHVAYDDESRAAVGGQTDVQREASEKLAAERKAQANYGQAGGGAISDSAKNPSGTFSEPTPTNVQYSNMDATEFENNHGSQVGKSAAGLRAELGLPDVTGGLYPQIDGAPSDSAPEQPEGVPEQRDPKVLEKAAAGETIITEDEFAKVEVAATNKGSNFSAMTGSQLREYASEQNIDLGDAKTKAEIIAAIEAAP